MAAECALPQQVLVPRNRSSHQSVLPSSANIPNSDTGGTRAMKAKDLLRVCVLGKLAVLRDNTPMPLPPSKKTRALLAYLAVTARTHSRNRLCAMFWNIPDDPRAALRWSLSRLRPLVDAPGCQRIVADRETVGLDLDGITVD